MQLDRLTNYKIFDGLMPQSLARLSSVNKQLASLVKLYMENGGSSHICNLLLSTMPQQITVNGIIDVVAAKHGIIRFCPPTDNEKCVTERRNKIYSMAHRELERNPVRKMSYYLADGIEALSKKIRPEIFRIGCAWSKLGSDFLCRHIYDDQLVVVYNPNTQDFFSFNAIDEIIKATQETRKKDDWPPEFSEFPFADKKNVKIENCYGIDAERFVTVTAELYRSVALWKKTARNIQFLDIRVFEPTGDYRVSKFTFSQNKLFFMEAQWKWVEFDCVTAKVRKLEGVRKLFVNSHQRFQVDAKFQLNAYDTASNKLLWTKDLTGDFLQPDGVFSAAERELITKENWEEPIKDLFYRDHYVVNERMVCSCEEFFSTNKNTRRFTIWNAHTGDLLSREDVTTTAQGYHGDYKTMWLIDHVFAFRCYDHLKLAAVECKNKKALNISQNTHSIPAQIIDEVVLNVVHVREKLFVNSFHCSTGQYTARVYALKDPILKKEVQQQIRSYTLLSKLSNALYAIVSKIISLLRWFFQQLGIYK